MWRKIPSYPSMQERTIFNNNNRNYRCNEASPQEDRNAKEDDNISLCTLVAQQLSAHVDMNEIINILKTCKKGAHESALAHA